VSAIATSTDSPSPPDKLIPVVRIQQWWYPLFFYLSTLLKTPYFNNTRKPIQERNNVSPDTPKLDTILDSLNT